FIANPKYKEHLYTSQASVIIIEENLVLTQPVSPTLIRVKDAYGAFAFLLEKFNEMNSRKGKKGVEQPSYVSPSASLGKDIYIGAFSYIGENALIGDGVRIYPGSYIGSNVVINEDSVLFAGVKV